MNHPYPKPKPQGWSPELYERASEFHGHGGPFLAVGLRMGALALGRLDSRGWFGITCVVILRREPPDMCVLDGLQVSTGCTLGKGNISVGEGNCVTATFEAAGRRIVVTLREGVLSQLHVCSNEEEADRLLEFVSSAPDGELFDVA